MSALKLYVFDCGMLRFESIEDFSIADDETDIRDLIVPCYVVEHEDGRLLWDGGLPSKTTDVDGWQGEGMLSRLDRTFSEQLPEIGLDMSSFDYAAYSHMHFDHVGAANAFSSAKLLIQDTEYQAAFVEKDNPYFQPDLYEELVDSEKEILSGDYDVFGDGSVVIISAPGHTPGHQVLLLKLDNFGPLILSGDLYHFRKSRELRRAPQFNVDAEQTFRSMDKVEALIKAEGATFWIEHDKALADTLDLAPAYYD